MVATAADSPQDPRAEAWAKGLYPKPQSEGRSRNMRAIRRTDTKPEVRLRSLLHRRGLRFRKDFRIDVPGRRVKADIVFTRQKVAIFIDGCFWHGCPDHGRLPSVNEWYWKPKLRGNVERDLDVNNKLRAAGWTVIRLWEHKEPCLMVTEVERHLNPGIERHPGR